MSCSVPYVPMVVAKESFIGLTADLATTTIFTPSEDGDYEIAIYGVVNPLASANMDPAATWTDEYGTYTRGFAGATTGTAGYSQGTVHAISGNPIQVSTTYGGSGNLYSYDLYVTVMKK